MLAPYSMLLVEFSFFNHHRYYSTTGTFLFIISRTSNKVYKMGVGSIKASLGYRPSSLEFDSQVSIGAPTPGHAPLHIQFTRSRRSFTVPPYIEFHTTNSTTLLMVRKGVVYSDSPSNCVYLMLKSSTSQPVHLTF